MGKVLPAVSSIFFQQSFQPSGLLVLVVTKCDLQHKGIYPFPSLFILFYSIEILAFFVKLRWQPTGLIAYRLRAAVLIRQRSLLHIKRVSCIGKSMQETCYYHIMREP